MFVSNNHSSFQLRSKKNLEKHQKVSKYYENDCRRRKNKKKKQRYSSSPSPSSSSNDDSDESKCRNNEGKESTDSRFRVVSEEDQYKYSLPPDMT